ncbi:MAG: c-type cytochrome [Chitinophagaceae bacterium]
MKKVIFTLMIAAGIYACGSSNTETTEQKPISNATEEPVKEEARAVAKKDGKALIEASDCRTCHKDDTKLIGPAYKDVAKKYPSSPDNIKMLAEKIMKGGQGNWGEIPMAAHPNVSMEDASAMVEYILTIK